MDLPQHAGQVALLNDFLLGNSNWLHLIEPNFLTPYLTTYLLIFALHKLFSLVIAVKLLLSFGFIAFVGMCIALRKQFNGNPSVDWLFFLGYFGYAWSFGFISFLIAAPIGLALIWAYCKFLESSSPLMAGFTVAIGSILLCTHGLMFLLFMTICFGILFQNVVFHKFCFNKSIPLLFLLIACIVFVASSQYFHPSNIRDGFSFSYIYWDYDFLGRIKEFLIYPLDHSMDKAKLLSPIIFVACFVLSDRFNSLKSPAIIPFLVLSIIFFIGPTYALKIQYLYQRIAIFTIPFFSFLFTQDVKVSNVKNRFNSNKLIAKIVLITCIWTQLWIYGHGIRLYSKESKPFESLLQALDSGERALYLPINAESDALNRDNVYLHYGQWYQAEKGGFVDFNFAWTPAIVMRFKNVDPSPIKPGFEWAPSEFDWKKNQGETFRYFIIKSKKLIQPEVFFNGASCIPKQIFRDGEWQVYESQICTDLR